MSAQRKGPRQQPKDAQEIRAKRLLAATEAKATNGALKNTVLATNAANYYRQAT